MGVHVGWRGPPGVMRRVRDRPARRSGKHPARQHRKVVPVHAVGMRITRNVGHHGRLGRAVVAVVAEQGVVGGLLLGRQVDLLNRRPLLLLLLLLMCTRRFGGHLLLLRGTGGGVVIGRLGRGRLMREPSVRGGAPRALGNDLRVGRGLLVVRGLDGRVGRLNGRMGRLSGDPLLLLVMRTLFSHVHGCRHLLLLLLLLLLWGIAGCGQAMVRCHGVVVRHLGNNLHTADAVGTLHDRGVVHHSVRFRVGGKVSRGVAGSPASTGVILACLGARRGVLALPAGGVKLSAVGRMTREPVDRVHRVSAGVWRIHAQIFGGLVVGAGSGRRRPLIELIARLARVCARIISGGQVSHILLLLVHVTMLLLLLLCLIHMLLLLLFHMLLLLLLGLGHVMLLLELLMLFNGGRMLLFQMLVLNLHGRLLLLLLLLLQHLLLLF